MKKTRKALSGVLAVWMLVSMLACFALPTAAEGAVTHYYVCTASDWNEMADTMAANRNGEGAIIHIQNDISFEGVTFISIDTFKGTLDGHGYKFTNITATSGDSLARGARVIKYLYGTIQNLTLDSTCKMVNNDSNGRPSGAFVSRSFGGTIKKCAFYGTYTTKYGTAMGGFVGQVASDSVTIDGCIFDGKLTNTAGVANAFVGDTSIGSITIKNSIARGEMTEAVTGTDEGHFDNSYAVVNDNASFNKTKEAVWKINNTRKAAENGEAEVYLNVDAAGALCFGDVNNCVVRLSTIYENTTTYSYHAPRTKAGSVPAAQTTIIPDASKTAKVTNAEYRDGTIYVDSRDITLEYVDSDAYNLEQAKKQLAAMVAAYKAMDQSYFSDWAPKAAWLTAAEEVLANGTSINRFQNQINAEDAIDNDVVPLSKPEDYPSISQYNTYKYIESIQDYKVTSKNDWLAAVDLSNFVSNPDAVSFDGITLHLTADIDMENASMLPLCYNWIFEGNLDGHDHVFKNINITIDSAYGGVGLIGVIGDVDGSTVRTVQNVGIESGTIKVTGYPRYKAFLEMSSTGNMVGGFAGKNYTKTLFRKCWNDANIYVEHIKFTAGIVGDSQADARVDCCFNLGYTEGKGILDYGRRHAIVSNSMSGPVQSSAVLYRADLYTNQKDEHTIENRMINISGVKSTLAFNNWGDTDQEEEIERQVLADFNKENTEFSNAAAAWKVNRNYVDQGYGERIYYTLNEEGLVRFGKADGSDQIYRMELVCDANCDGDGLAECSKHPDRYVYGVTGRELTLSYDFEANYYACEDEHVTIRDNKLAFENDPENEDLTYRVYVGYNADRGNVDGDEGGDVNLLDVLSAVWMVVNPEKANLPVADVDSDYDVDTNDAYHIIRYWLNAGNDRFTPGNNALQEEDYLKILSYNYKGLRYDPYTVEGGNGKALCRYNSVLAEIAAIDADIMGFQEVLVDCKVSAYKNTLELLLNGLKAITGEDYYVHYVPQKEYSGGGTSGNGIFSKYPLPKYENEEDMYKAECFTGMGRLDDPTKQLDDVAPRCFAWYKLDIDGDGYYTPEKDIIFYNCHLSTATVEGASAAETQYMIRYINEHHANDRVVFVGDYNLAAYKVEDVIKKEGAEDTITALNGGKKFDTYVATNAYSGSMVDNIMINDNVEYFAMAENRQNNVNGVFNSATLYGPEEGYINSKTEGQVWSASDHMPIWAYIKK